MFRFKTYEDDGKEDFYDEKTLAAKNRHCTFGDRGRRILGRCDPAYGGSHVAGGDSGAAGRKYRASRRDAHRYLFENGRSDGTVYCILGGSG